MRTHPAGLLQHGGIWMSTDGATFLTWEQERFRWSPDKVYYYRGAKMLFKTEPNTKENDDGSTTQIVILQDCESVPMYSLVVRGQEGRFEYDIHDQTGDMVARARYDTAKDFPNQLLFTDRFEMPIAVAESPAITNLADLVEGQHRPPEYAIRPWQVSFYGATTTNSSLMLAQNRWVIIAVVQDHAIRVSGESGQLPDFRPWFVGVCVAVLAVVVAVLSAVSRLINVAVYPPVSREIDNPNPFLKPTGAYGSLGPSVWESKVPKTISPPRSAGQLSPGSPTGWSFGSGSGSPASLGPQRGL